MMLFHLGPVHGLMANGKLSSCCQVQSLKRSLVRGLVRREMGSVKDQANYEVGRRLP